MRTIVLWRTATHKHIFISGLTHGWRRGHPTLVRNEGSGRSTPFDGIEPNAPATATRKSHDIPPGPVYIAARIWLGRRAGERKTILGPVRCRVALFGTLLWCVSCRQGRFDDCRGGGRRQADPRRAQRLLQLVSREGG